MSIPRGSFTELLRSSDSSAEQRLFSAVRRIRSRRRERLRRSPHATLITSAERLWCSSVGMRVGAGIGKFVEKQSKGETVDTQMLSPHDKEKKRNVGFGPSLAIPFDQISPIERRVPSRKNRKDEELSDEEIDVSLDSERDGLYFSPPGNATRWDETHEGSARVVGQHNEHEESHRMDDEVLFEEEGNGRHGHASREHVGSHSEEEKEKVAHGQSGKSDPKISASSVVLPMVIPPKRVEKDEENFTTIHRIPLTIVDDERGDALSVHSDTSIEDDRDGENSNDSQSDDIKERTHISETSRADDGDSVPMARELQTLEGKKQIESETPSEIGEDEEDLHHPDEHDVVDDGSVDGDICGESELEHSTDVVELVCMEEGHNDDDLCEDGVVDDMNGDRAQDQLVYEPLEEQREKRKENLRGQSDGEMKDVEGHADHFDAISEGEAKIVEDSCEDSCEEVGSQEERKEDHVSDLMDVEDSSDGTMSPRDAHASGHVETFEHDDVEYSRQVAGNSPDEAGVLECGPTSESVVDAIQLTPSTETIDDEASHEANVNVGDAIQAEEEEHRKTVCQSESDQDGTVSDGGNEDDRSNTHDSEDVDDFQHAEDELRHLTEERTEHDAVTNDDDQDPTHLDAECSSESIEVSHTDLHEIQHEKESSDGDNVDDVDDVDVDDVDVDVDDDGDDDDVDGDVDDVDVDDVDDVDGDDDGDDVDDVDDGDDDGDGDVEYEHKEHPSPERSFCGKTSSESGDEMDLSELDEREGSPLMEMAESTERHVIESEEVGEKPLVHDEEDHPMGESSAAAHHHEDTRIEMDDARTKTPGIPHAPLSKPSQSSSASRKEKNVSDHVRVGEVQFGPGVVDELKSRLAHASTSSSSSSTANPTSSSSSFSSSLPPLRSDRGARPSTAVIHHHGRVGRGKPMTMNGVSWCQRTIRPDELRGLKPRNVASGGCMTPERMHRFSVHFELPKSIRKYSTPKSKSDDGFLPSMSVDEDGFSKSMATPNRVWRGLTKSPEDWKNELILSCKSSVPHCRHGSEGHSTRALQGKEEEEEEERSLSHCMVSVDKKLDFSCRRHSDDFLSSQKEAGPSKESKHEPPCLTTSSKPSQHIHPSKRVSMDVERQPPRESYDMMMQGSHMMIEHETTSEKTNIESRYAGGEEHVMDDGEEGEEGHMMDDDMQRHPNPALVTSDARHRVLASAPRIPAGEVTFHSKSSVPIADGGPLSLVYIENPDEFFSERKILQNYVSNPSPILKLLSKGSNLLKSVRSGKRERRKRRQHIFSSEHSLHVECLTFYSMLCFQCVFCECHFPQVNHTTGSASCRRIKRSFTGVDQVALALPQKVFPPNIHLVIECVKCDHHISFIGLLFGRSENHKHSKDPPWNCHEKNAGTHWRTITAEKGVPTAS
jgi:hypothetical protein